MLKKLLSYLFEDELTVINHPFWFTVKNKQTKKKHTTELNYFVVILAESKIHLSRTFSQHLLRHHEPGSACKGYKAIFED